jgi:hypothetical protein
LRWPQNRRKKKRFPSTTPGRRDDLFCQSPEIPMLKFYFNGAPNPNKVALFLEESGLPFEPVPVDTRKGDQFKPEFLKVNPNGKVPAIDDDGVKVFDSNAILLYLAEKTGKFLPPTSPSNRAIAVMADVHRDRPRALFRPGGAFQAFRAEGP